MCIVLRQILILLILLERSGWFQMFYETRGKQVVYTMGADMETHPVLRVLSELTVEMMSIPETSFATGPKPMVTRRY